MIKIIILILIPFTLNAQTLSVDDWLAKYSRPCKGLKNGMVCKEKLDASLNRMRRSIVPKMLEDNGLPVWLSTVPIIESDYNSKAESKAGATGLFQIMKFNCTLYFTKRRQVMMPLKSRAGLKFVETIIDTKPTIAACKKLLEDPVVNTHIAAWLLIKLYRKYKDWELSLQAFNIGEPRLDKYLAGKRGNLPFETQNYFVQLMAIQKYIEEME